MFKRFFLPVFFFSVFATTVFGYNPKDPIGWSNATPFPSSVTTNGGVYITTFTFINQTGHTLVHPIQIAKTATPSGEFTYVDGCSGTLLAYGQTCTVQVDLTPVTAGTKSLQLTIQGWSNAQVPVPQPAMTTTASENTSVSVTGTATGTWSTTMSVGQSQNFTFAFTNHGSAPATGVGVSCSNAASCTSFCGSSLANGSSCNVTGTFVATSAMVGHPATVSATFKYSQGAPVTASEAAVTVSPASGFVGSVVPASATIIQNQDTPITFTFTNYNSTAITSNATVYSTLASGQTFTGITNGCTAGVAGNGGTCTITGTYKDTNAAPSSAALTATLTPTPPTSPTTSSATSTLTVAGTLTGSRTIIFNNQCSFPVWVGMNSGVYTTNTSPNGVTCSSTSDPCPSGTTCNVAAGLCYWNTYPTTSGNFELAGYSSGSVPTTSIIIPNTPAVAAEGFSAANTIFWHGGFAGRTGCTAGGTCVTADCGQGVDGCKPGIGFNAPDTQAETTFQPGAVEDTYDVETIDGFNIPVQIAPTSGAIPDSGAPYPGYQCATAAGIAAQTTPTTFSACDWSTAPNNFPEGTDPSSFYWVSATVSGVAGTACTTQTTCTNLGNGTICGIAQVPVNPGVSPPKVAKRCGKFLGYMTAKQACAFDIPDASRNAQALGFNCNTIIEGGQVSNLYGCTDTYHPSCYSSGTPCCGCLDWSEPEVAPGFIPAHELCQSHDSAWATYSPTYVQWMKRTCSNVYTYPYDDKTSTFNCTNSTSSNTLGYTVTFCAGSNTGIPSTYSLDDGRNG